jgi:hypothetical protein
MCCGRRVTGSRGSGDTADTTGGSTTGPTAGTYTITATDGTMVIKASEIAARLYVATHPGSTYTKN